VSVDVCRGLLGPCVVPIAGAGAGAGAGCRDGRPALELLERDGDDRIPTLPSWRLSLVLAISSSSSVVVTAAAACGGGGG
jgi:hypothetical protein